MADEGRVNTNRWEKWWPDPLGDPMWVDDPALLWTYDEISDAINGSWLADLDEGQPITGAGYQFGQIRPGDLLFEQNTAQWLKKRREHSAGAYFKRGASALITANDRHLPDAGMNIMRVPNSRTAVLELGQYARDRLAGTVVGVTGTAGKSTTKEMLRVMLGHENPTVASRGNFNHSQGLAISLAQTPPSIEYAIYELGVGNPKHTQGRVDMLKPHVAMITDIFYDHLKYYKRIEDYADQKSMIFETVQVGGVAVLNRDGEFFDRLNANRRDHGNPRLLTFGKHPEADLRVVDCELEASRSTFMVSDGASVVDCEINVPGQHMVTNALGALALVCACGLDWKHYSSYLPEFRPLFQRTEWHDIKLNISESFVFIDDCFNANSGSMQAGLNLLMQLQVDRPAKQIIILGDMLGLGRFSKKQHEALLPFVLKQSNCCIYLFGDEMLHLYRKLPENRKDVVYCQHFAEMENDILDSVSNGDLVYFKASDPDDIYMPFIARLKDLSR
ncbi:MAG: UDP-N-acetylmuramoyl-tripeptide--D-alanyl-D-alanine ligase [Pseudomonadota bacterium]